nr:uncharacterized protein LOC110376263 isoform X1 [Helicoverpa armigera]
MNCFIIIFLALIALSRQGKLQSTYEEKYALYHCLQKKTCTPGGDKVCGVDLKTKVVAEFPDKCTLHGVNCNKMGFYWKLDTDHCAATVIFGAELFHLGQPQGYETVTPSQTPANTTKSVFPSWIAERIKKSFASLLNRTHVTQMR